MTPTTVTSIKAQVKNAERVSVYVNGSYSFSLNHAQLLDQKLRVGLVLSPERLEELKKISEFGKAFERVLGYIMIRPRSKREITDYCWRKKITPEDCEAIIAKLTARGYVNDAHFAKAWIESRRLTKAVSERKLRQELMQKGITPSLIDESLSTSDYSEPDALTALIAKKRRISRYQDVQKFTQYLVRQGFSYSDVKAALAEESETED